METRTIVVKNIEVGGSPGGAGGAPGGGRDPLAGLARIVVRVLLVVLALALVIPAIVLGGACVVAALVIGVLLWALRRLLGVRAGPAIRVTGIGMPFPGGPAAGAAPSAGEPADGGRENVRVRR